MTLRLFFVAFLLAVVVRPTEAADFSVSYATEEAHLRMVGTIGAGDAESLVALVLTLASKGGVEQVPRLLVVDSGGGSVLEAARIASVVELLRLSTFVRGDEFVRGGSPGVCASACFLVWLAGNSRFAAGNYASTGDKLLEQIHAISKRTVGMVGIHRPYVDLKESSSASMLESQREQRLAMANLQTYLQSKNVPSGLVDKMMASSSKNIHWLTPEEIDQLAMSPEYEELLAANCGFRNFRISAESTNDEIRLYLDAHTTVAEKQLRECSRALVSRLRNRELPPLFSRMRAGWRPWQ